MPRCQQQSMFLVGTPYQGQPFYVHLLPSMPLLLHAALIAPKRVAQVAAAFATTQFGLFLEFSHSLRIGPAWAQQIIVMLIAVLLKTTPHMALSLMTSVGT